jgi:hypothetical protein
VASDKIRKAFKRKINIQPINSTECEFIGGALEKGMKYNRMIQNTADIHTISKEHISKIQTPIDKIL